MTEPGAFSRQILLEFVWRFEYATPRTRGKHFAEK